MIDPRVLQLLGGAALLGDYGQTRAIAANPDRWHETNPLLGEHPSEGKVNLYFALAGLSHLAANKFLPKDMRTGWNVGLTALELANIIRNRKLGIGFNFKL